MKWSHLARVPRVSPAMVVALIALGLGFGGLAVAATSGSRTVITACYSKATGAMRFDAGGKKCQNSEKKVAWNSQGRQGLKGTHGLAGAPGAQGLQGIAGQNGSPAASMLTGEGNTAPTSATTSFAEPVGQTVTVSSPEATHDELSPNATVVARDLAVRITGPVPNGGTNFTFAIRVNGTDTAAQCSIPAGQATCNSGSASAQIPAGSLIVLAITATGPVDGFARPFAFGWRATTP